MKELQIKMSMEMQSFLNSFQTEIPTEIYRDWKIIGFYETLYGMFLTNDFVKCLNKAQTNWLLTFENPINFLWSKWIFGGSFAHFDDWSEMLEFVISVYEDCKED